MSFYSNNIRGGLKSIMRKQISQASKRFKSWETLEKRSYEQEEEG
jgi:hypothetical protein